MEKNLIFGCQMSLALFAHRATNGVMDAFTVRYVLCHLKGASMLSSMVFFWSYYVHWLLFQLVDGAFHLYRRSKVAPKGPKKGQNWHLHDVGPLFNGTGWNEVGTTLRTSRLSSLVHFPDYNVPNVVLMRPKRGQKRLKISLLATQIGQEGQFCVGRRLEHNREHPDKSGGSFFKGLQNWQKQAKIWF